MSEGKTSMGTDAPHQYVVELRQIPHLHHKYRNRHLLGQPLLKILLLIWFAKFHKVPESVVNGVGGRIAEALRTCTTLLEQAV